MGFVIACLCRRAISIAPGRTLPISTTVLMKAQPRKPSSRNHLANAGISAFRPAPLRAPCRSSTSSNQARSFWHSRSARTNSFLLGNWQ